jgi:hypothetical protein
VALDGLVRHHHGVARPERPAGLVVGFAAPTSGQFDVALDVLAAVLGEALGEGRGGDPVRSRRVGTRRVSAQA